MIAGLRQRIAKLEGRTSTGPVTLVFSDGTQRVIKGSTRHWQRLNTYLFERDAAEAEGLPLPESPLAIELQWLADCTDITGENCQAFFLTRALAGCNEEEQDNEE